MTAFGYIDDRNHENWINLDQMIKFDKQNGIVSLVGDREVFLPPGVSYVLGQRMYELENKLEAQLTLKEDEND